MGTKINAGPAPQSSQETTDQILASYTKYIPSILAATTSGTTSQAQAELDAAKAVTPGYNQLALDSINQYGQQVADANNKVSTAVLQGSGKDTALAAKALEDAVNPEYAEVRKAGGAQATNLINSINLAGLTGGERAEVERSLGQSNTATGNLGLDNATNAVSAAMNYGDRMSKKRGELAAAIDTGTRFLGTEGGTPSPVNTALGNSATSFTAAAPQSSNASLGFGTGALNSIAGANASQNALMANYNYLGSSINKLNNIGANS